MMSTCLLGERVQRRSAIVSLTIAVFLVLYLVAVSPHLVRHAFENHHGPPECPLLIQSQLTTAVLQDDTLTVGPPVLAGTLPEQKLTPYLPSPPRHSSQPRAPPPLVSA